MPYRLPFIVKGATIENGKETSQMVLEDIKRIKNLPEKTFLPPKGYRKISQVPGGERW